MALEGPWESDYKIIAQPKFTEAITAISTITFSYAGTPFYFPIVAECATVAITRRLWYSAKLPLLLLILSSELSSTSTAGHMSLLRL